MTKTKIGIRKEDKNQWERRAPLIPAHVGSLIKEHQLEIWVQPSKIRIFADEDYALQGAMIEEDLSPCSIILAVKEIPIHFFRPKKIYIFFSHTIKCQAHNMPMLKKMIEFGCTLIDYEKIVDGQGRRLLFFGKQAGQAGMIDTLWALGQRLTQLGIKNPFANLKQAYYYQSLVEAKEEIKKVGWQIYNHGLHSTLVPLICGFAGYGHVSQGAQEIFNLLPMEEVSPSHLLQFIKNRQFSASKVYKTVFKEEDMVAPLESGEKFELQDYYQNPERYKSIFESYLPYLTILVNCIYWTPKYPRFVTKKFLKELWRFEDNPRLKVIGDISCDVEGSIECTLHSTDPGQPVFTYNPLQEKAIDGFQGKGVVIMAVDNLPAEISLESSIFFSQALMPFVPPIAQADYSQSFSSLNLPEPIKRAIILYQGQFTPGYQYMKKFI